MPCTRSLSRALAALAIALPLAANAGFRCQNGHLVNEGDSISYLLQQCGDPLHQSNIVNNQGVVVGQRYRYVDQNDSSWVYVVDVLNDKVQKVTTERQ